MMILSIEAQSNVLVRMWMRDVDESFAQYRFSVYDMFHGE